VRIGVWGPAAGSGRQGRASAQGRVGRRTKPFGLPPSKPNPLKPQTDVYVERRPIASISARVAEPIGRSSARSRVPSDRRGRMSDRRRVKLAVNGNEVEREGRDPDDARRFSCASSWI